MSRGLDKLEDLADSDDTDAFIDEAISYILEMSDEELHSPDVPTEEKISAIHLMRDYLLEQEAYEKCAILKKIEDRINAKE
jgi:hypothetical protein